METIAGMEGIFPCSSGKGMSVLGFKQVFRGIFWGNGLVVIELRGGWVARCEDVVFEH